WRIGQDMVPEGDTLSVTAQSRDDLHHVPKSIRATLRTNQLLASRNRATANWTLILYRLCVMSALQCDEASAGLTLKADAFRVSRQDIDRVASAGSHCDRMGKLVGASLSPTLDRS